MSTNLTQNENTWGILTLATKLKSTVVYHCLKVTNRFREKKNRVANLNRRKRGKQRNNRITEVQ